MNRKGRAELMREMGTYRAVSEDLGLPRMEAALKQEGGRS